MHFRFSSCTKQHRYCITAQEAQLWGGKPRWCVARRRAPSTKAPRYEGSRVVSLVMFGGGIITVSERSVCLLKQTLNVNVLAVSIHCTLSAAAAAATWPSATSSVSSTSMVDGCGRTTPRGDTLGDAGWAGQVASSVCLVLERRSRQARSEASAGPSMCASMCAAACSSVGSGCCLRSSLLRMSMSMCGIGTVSTCSKRRGGRPLLFRGATIGVPAYERLQD